MDPADHAAMASTGSSKAAKAFRKTQEALVSSGKFRQAMQMDIKDAMAKFGSKYKDAISQMVKYYNDFLKTL